MVQTEHMNYSAIRRQFFDAIADQWNTMLSEDDCSFIKHVLSFVPFQYETGKRLLDIGCGTGILFPFLSDWEVVALDYSPQMLVRAQQFSFPWIKEYICADAHHLPLPDIFFARVLMFSVYPHFDNPEQVIRETYRVLKKNGCIIIFHLNNSQTINSIHSHIDGPVSHDFLPPASEVAKLLVKHGFLIKHCDDSERFVVIGLKK